MIGIQLEVRAYRPKCQLNGWCIADKNELLAPRLIERNLGMSGAPTQDCPLKIGSLSMAF